MQKIPKVKKFLPIFLLFIVELLLFLTNYNSGTYLLGWDNLFPEINFKENITRSFFGVWQEYRGLGLLDGMSFAANLPHYLFLAFIDLILPLNLLRYLFISFMHFLGGLGMYFLLQELLKKHQNKSLSAFLGSLFYLLNIGTVQIFFAPYEVFVVHFAFLPLLLFLTVRFLRYGIRQDLLLFFLFSFLSTPQAHVPSVFLVYLIAFFTVLFFNLVTLKKKALKRILVVFLLTLLINSYWGLPYIYSALNNAKIISNSKINQMSTENIYLKNKAFGDFKNTSLIKGFFLDFIDMQNNKESGYMMHRWREHTKKTLFEVIAFSIFVSTLIGLILTIRKKMPDFYPFVTLFIFSFLMLGIDIPLLKVFYGSLRNYIPYFFQIFRFSFTKFSIIYVLSIAMLSTVLISFVLEKLKDSGKAVLIFTISLLILLGYYSYPLFQGQFYYKNLKIKIPKEYFDTVNYLNNQNKNERIATLPQADYWGWTNTGWGYRGSGFLWFGISQPTLDGAFYPWSRENENYYWEISYALYSQNQELFEKVLEKYQINWLLVDGNVINPSSPKALYLDELEEMVGKSDKISLAKTFGKIKIYQVNLETPVKDFIFLTQDPPVIEPSYRWNNLDTVYLEYGLYLSDLTSHFLLPTSNVYYPFRSLFSGKNQEDLEFEVEDHEGYFVFKKSIPENLKDYLLRIPEFNKEELMWVDPNDLSKTRFVAPEVNFDDQLIEVKIPKVGGYFSAKIDSAKDPSVQSPKNCNQFSQGEVKNEIIEENGKKFLRLSSIDATNCSASFWLPNLPHKIGYLITVENRNLAGKSLLFWLENLNARKADIETYLPKFTPNGEISYFIQPPMEKDGLGYTLHFDNLSIGRDKTVNDLGKINISPIPYSFLTSLKLVSPQLLKNTQKSTVILPTKVSHPNPSFYQLTIEPSNNQTILVLSQAFHQGWQAYQINEKLKIKNKQSLFSRKLENEKLRLFLAPILGEKIKNHVLVNNWANGWILDSSQLPITNNQLLITIIYLPQYLEYLGFLLLLMGIYLVK